MRLERLDNGLRVVVAPQPQLHRAHLALYVRIGSRFETPKTNGLSHFLEHMLYRGTPRLRNAHEVNLAVEVGDAYRDARMRGSVQAWVEYHCHVRCKPSSRSMAGDQRKVERAAVVLAVMVWTSTRRATS